MKKLLVISLLLALVMALVFPTAVAASSPPATFAAQGSLTSIDTGNVKELGHSGKWLVSDRHIRGGLTGGLNGDFVLTYGGVFDLATQEGNLVGTLKTDSATLLVTAKVDPLSFVPADVPGGYLPMLMIEGKWIGMTGLKANGDFQAYVVFVPTADGHVGFVVDSGFVMTGKYLGKNR